MLSKRYYTIGMAGHIDHGKTTLTKALTNVDTDRLKAEKERSISIELGYAPLKLGDNMEVSIVDVPGHEKFIRQMIAGVAGIDLVLLVVAADEGVMPQTVEHLDILNLLGIHEGLIVVTKADLVEDDMEELIEADIADQVAGTFFEGAELHFVDSLSGRGIDDLRSAIRTKLADVQMRDARGAFRLPVDQVFTVHGQGTVVRGTVYEGKVTEGDTLEVLPERKKVRARQIQVHHEKQPSGRAGQRVAINLGGASKDELQRGDVLVSTQYYSTTTTVDITLDTVENLRFPLKQRGYIKLHLGTAEVYGKIVFFDRNELSVSGGQGILCQLRLDHPVVTKRGDRFILRRPSPVETIGGGFVIEPNGQKYRFGEETIKQLERKREGTPEDLLFDLLKTERSMTRRDLTEKLGTAEEELDELLVAHRNEGTIRTEAGRIFLQSVAEELLELMQEDLAAYHQLYPLRDGKDRAVLLQEFASYGKELTSLVLDEAADRGELKKHASAVALGDFAPGFPKQWAKRMEQVEQTIKNQGLEVEQESEIFERAGLPAEWIQELRHYLMRSNKVIELDEKHLLSVEAFNEAARKLSAETTERFSLQDAKQVLGLSRKYLVPLMEKFDQAGWTRRDGSERLWVKTPE
ncbi:selenocysteine-specific translation elongation factor [Salisediminibacterium halotolerans]|uniref:Selenocysteine-specific elongation factor n=1 Tax=Salisediminibacterium halotolerans TaxID=517425 RepID=A0A1H9W5L0_9BACI|nr:selenocysteine-specific translation elongation factor [Salisediminibacterium haloalkalitolerans]SES29061.1 selenocysteine-specific elongation factor [Salisediminibacterium haloalkalitolerans]